MGDGKRRKLSYAEIKAKEPRCIYCPGQVETIDHMPPISMFRDRDRPRGMEYAACKRCNEGASGSDTVAAVFALIHPNNGPESWQAKKVRKLISALDQRAPGVRAELSLPDKWRSSILRRDSGLFQRVVEVHANGPLVKSYLSVFGAKLAMALFREHVGVALPIEGAVWCQFTFNAGMTQENLDARVQILPFVETLRQGRKQVGDQFSYRYNCDERTTLAAVVQFHRGLWVTLFASSDQKIIDLMSGPDFNGLPGSMLTRPGKLLELFPQ